MLKGPIPLASRKSPQVFTHGPARSKPICVSELRHTHTLSYHGLLMIIRLLAAQKAQQACKFVCRNSLQEHDGKAREKVEPETAATFRATEPRPDAAPRRVGPSTSPQVRHTRTKQSPSPASLQPSHVPVPPIHHHRAHDDGSRDRTTSSSD